MNGLALMKQEEDSVCLQINEESCQKKKKKSIREQNTGGGRAEGEEVGAVLAVDASWGISGLFFLERPLKSI